MTIPPFFGLTGEWRADMSRSIDERVLHFHDLRGDYAAVRVTIA
jgi:hypothetical protein